MCIAKTSAGELKTQYNESKQFLLVAAAYLPMIFKIYMPTDYEILSTTG